MNILHLIPTLDYTGAAAQLGLLASRLSAAHSQRVCCLGGEGPWAQKLRARGQRVDCLRWTRTFDATPLWKLHRLLKAEPPDLIHVWGMAPLRTLGLVARRWLPRALVSVCMPQKLKKISRLDGWLLRRVGKVATSSECELAQCQQLGVPERKVVMIAPGVEIPSSATMAGAPVADKRIMCIGALEPRKGFRDAIWAFDILHYVFKDTRLALVGDGPQRSYLQWFAARLERTNDVDFLGRRDDVPALLMEADVCWAPTVAGSSRQVVLEALAAGRPVVAADQPALREIIADGQTGFLVPSGDKVAICKRTRSLLLDPAFAQQMGEAARLHVTEHFGAESCAREWLELYQLAA